MKQNVSHTTTLSGNHPLTTTTLPAYRASTLRLFSTEETDFADTTLRFFLMLCLLASLAICGVQSRPAASHDFEGTGPAVPAWSQVVPHLPALPAVDSCSLMR